MEWNQVRAEQRNERQEVKPHADVDNAHYLIKASHQLLLHRALCERHQNVCNWPLSFQCAGIRENFLRLELFLEVVLVLWGCFLAESRCGAGDLI